MINTYEKNNHFSQKENKKSAFKMVIFPLIGFIFLVLIISNLILRQNSIGQQSILNWVNISIIVISVFLFIPLLFLLVLIIGTIVVIKKSSQTIQSGLWKLQRYVFLISKILINITKIILMPFIYLESALNFLHKPKS
jgi:hypothetical protein